MKEKECKYCKSTINKKAKICPNCGKKQRKPIIAIIVIVFILAAVAGIFGSGDSDVEKKEKFTVEVTKSYSDSMKIGYFIEGTVLNNTDKDYGYLQVEFICYDATGVNLGSAFDNTNNLLANQTWKFKAMAMFSDVGNIDHCEYHEVTGF